MTLIEKSLSDKTISQSKFDMCTAAIAISPPECSLSTAVIVFEYQL
jgi:hypothetical protein